MTDYPFILLPDSDSDAESEEEDAYGVIIERAMKRTALDNAIYYCNDKLVTLLMDLGAPASKWGWSMNPDDNLTRSPIDAAVVMVRYFITDLYFRPRKRSYKKVLAALEHGINVRRVRNVGGWRPHNAHLFPCKYRSAMRTLLLLAKCRHVVNGKQVERFPRACLELLPEELLQWIYGFITGENVEPTWLE